MTNFTELHDAHVDTNFCSAAELWLECCFIAWHVLDRDDIVNDYVWHGRLRFHHAAEVKSQLEGVLSRMADRLIASGVDEQPVTGMALAFAKAA